MRRSRVTPASIVKWGAIPLLLLALVLGTWGGWQGEKEGNSGVLRNLSVYFKPVQIPVTHTPSNANRPLLAFYYSWYIPSSWCLCHMSDLPTVQYDSSDDATIDRQVRWAATAGIT